VRERNFEVANRTNGENDASARDGAIAHSRAQRGHIELETSADLGGGLGEPGVAQVLARPL